MNTYNVATLNNLNSSELNNMIAAKQKAKQAFTLQAIELNSQLDDLRITTDLKANLFTSLSLKLDGLKVSLKNIELFLDSAASAGFKSVTLKSVTLKSNRLSCVSLAKRSFVSLSKPPLAKVQLSSVSLARGL